MFSSPFSREESRAYRNEYRELFEYSLSQRDQSFWRQVIKNYDELTEPRQKILKSKLKPEEIKAFNESIGYLRGMLNKEQVWVPQSMKDYLMYFKSKRLYDYLHSLQASVLEN